jgi:AcrR family transcriptional regulator
MQSAIKLFAKRGFDSTSMREIAEKAGVTKPMIYYYYKDKEDLYFSLLDEYLSKFIQKVSEVFTLPLTPQEKIQRFVELYVTHLKKNRNIFRIINREITGGRKNVDKLTDNYFSKIHTDLTKVIDDGTKDESFKVLDPHATAFSLVGIIIFYFAERKVIERLTGGEVQTEKLIDSLHTHILSLLLSS